MKIFNPLFSTPEMQTVFSEEMYLQKLVEYELALAFVQGKSGVIPEEAADKICSSLLTFQADFKSITEQTEKSSIPTIELLNQMRKHVGGDAASFIHWGATSQDVMDTAVVLQVGDALSILEKDLKQLMLGLAEMTDKYRDNLMAGRTHSQQALPITFGLKVANWLSPLLRQYERLNALKAQALTLQFGGAVGTLASLGSEGLSIQEALAKKLKLNAPLTSWHTQRDNFLECANWLAMLSSSLAKMAQDIILMAQTENAELKESSDPERGGSSTMPQKANPVQSELILAAARQNAQHLAAMYQAAIQEHERATHGWQLEWLNLPSMFVLTASAVSKAKWLASNIVVNQEKMLANVKASQGFMMAEAISFEFAGHMARAKAKALVKAAVQQALKEQRHLIDVLQENHDLPINWNYFRDESNYLGVTDRLIERVLRDVKMHLG